MADPGRVTVKAANPEPCTHCPWRLANQSKKDDPHKFYTPANLKRLWVGLRRGERMTCHPTDSRMAEFEGFEHQADRKVTHECAGALILQQREFMEFQRITKAFTKAKQGDTYKRYKLLRPNGMTLDGLRCVAERAMFIWPGEVPMAKLELVNPSIDYPAIGQGTQRSRAKAT